MSEREYIEVSFRTYREAQALIHEARAKDVPVSILSKSKLKKLEPNMDKANYRDNLDVHNLCMFLESADKGWLIVISNEPDGTTIDWVLGQ